MKGLHTCSGPLVSYNGANSTPQRIEILPLNSDNFDSVPFECFRNIVSFQVFRRVSGKCDIIVIDEKFDVESLGNCEPCSFSIVTFLLRAIRAEAKNGLVAVSERNTVDMRPCIRLLVEKMIANSTRKVNTPHMPKTS